MLYSLKYKFWLFLSLLQLYSLITLYSQGRVTDDRIITEEMRYSVEKSFNSWSLSLGAGPLFMYTDITDYSVFPDHRWRVATALTLSKQLKPVVGVDLQLVKGDMFSRDQKYWFKGDLYDVTLAGSLYLNHLAAMSGPVNDRWNFYLKTGIGFTAFRSRLYFAGSDQIVREDDLGIEGVDRYMVHGFDVYSPEEKSSRQKEVIIPFGAGVQYRINNRFDLGFESVMRFSTRDNLDNVLTGPTNDRYLFTGLTLNVKLGREKRHTRWTYRGYGFDLFGRVVGDTHEEELVLLKEEVERLKSSKRVVERSVFVEEHLTILYGRTDIYSFFFDRFGDTQFYFDDKTAIADAVLFLQNNPDSFISLYGYVDKSDDGDHDKISLEYCRKVKNYIVENFKVDRDSIIINAMGSSVGFKGDGEINVNRRVDLITTR
ncbi:hypothetical protein QA597_04740 [Marinilabiliaceae bacterium ANBcel2]|nr:hypothetical protein [Marinilabiliaceae bacterium ANBcel2]